MSLPTTAAEWFARIRRMLAGLEPPPAVRATPVPASGRSPVRRRRARSSATPVVEPTSTMMPLGRGAEASPLVPESLRRLETIGARYQALAHWMVEAHGLRVRRWRSGTSGVAWEVRRRGRAVERWIEAPYPKGPVSCAVFLHEVAHHSIGVGRVSPRCLEEFHAWRWAIECMEAAGLPPSPLVLRRRDASLRHALAKALRRGIREVPVELEPWRPAPRRRRTGATTV
ncbi:MAG: hypothetical protein FJ257_03940 [Phycisphaerae bacterium]|nr:hypothetical protein [Phycisphaerae bacterium]